MIELLYNPYFWLVLALIFNTGHTLFHVAFFRGYNTKNSSIYDGTVGYLGAFCVFVFIFLDRHTVQLAKSIAIPLGITLLFGGIYIHLKAQLDFHKYRKEMTLVSKGIYGYLRHPMYLGWSIAVIGAVIAGRSYLGLVTFWIWILLIVICGYLEEVKLRNDLPQGKYADYSKRTWL